MASQGDREGTKRWKVPRHWNDEYIKGEIHQSWGPDEEFYPLFPRDADVHFATFQLTTPLAAGMGNTASALVLVSTGTAAAGETITVYNTGGYRSYVGLIGLAAFTGGQWWIIVVDQHCLQFYATLSTNTHNMSTSGNIPGSVAAQITLEFSAAESLTPYPFSFLPAAGTLTVTNPQNFFGKAGDKVLVAHKRNTGDNEIIELYPAFARSIYALFDQEVPAGSVTPTTQCSPYAASPLGSVGEIAGASFNVEDPFYKSHRGQVNDRTLIVRNEIENRWEIVDCEHEATVVLGNVVADFTADDPTFEIQLTDGTGFNGEKPSGNLTVQNIFGYALQTGDPVVARWDPVAGEWIPIEAYPQSGKSIQYTITSVTISSMPDFSGLKVADVVVRVGPPELVGETVSVYDHSGCVFDLPNDELPGFTGWAIWGRSISLDTSKSCTPTPPLTPWHWAASNRCCDPDTGTYRDC